MATVINKRSSGFLIRLVFIAWIVSKSISYMLWMGNREFPLVPVWDWLLAIPFWVHFAIFVSSLALMALSVFSPQKLFAWIVLCLEIFSCLLDQNRWQPWEYQFLFFLFCYASMPTEDMLRKSWQVILVSTYFFGGLFKFNPYFIHDTWQYLILIKWLHIIPTNEWILRAGYIIPLIEMLAGFFLLFRVTQRMAAILLIAMHVFILLLLGPTGLDINAVVWPWNIFLAILLFALFIPPSQAIFGGEVLYRPAFILLIIAWLLMPWFRFGGVWDKYLSSVLYGGGVEQLFICSNNPEALQMTAPFRNEKFSLVPCSSAIPVYKWGMHEMRTAPYPEQRVFKRIMKSWGKKYGSAQFYLFKPGFKSTVKVWNREGRGGWQTVR